MSDCAWIAKLLQHGLIAPSFGPPPPQRDLRELTRQRVQLVRQKAVVANRIQKVLEDANLKLGSVASDVLGKSGRAMLRALIRGEHDPRKLAELAEGRSRAKAPELRPALEGHFSDHHRFLVEQLLGHLDELGRHVEEVSGRIAERLRRLLDEAQLKRLDAIPGGNRTTIENVIVHHPSQEC